MKRSSMIENKGAVIGFDVGGAHLKVARAEDGRIVAARTYATPLWQGLETLVSAFGQAGELCEGADRAVLTMTGELCDAFDSRAAGVRGLLELIEKHTPVPEKQIYAGRAGIVSLADAASMPADVASANWHATASLVGKLIGEALFVDMGSTTTDIIPVREKPCGEGYTDAERLMTGGLVYTGFTRSFLFAIASSAPVKGRMSPLMNEYFATSADAHRILGVLDEADDLQATADGKEKTVEASTARLARMVGLDAEDLGPDEWRDVAGWFSEQQLRGVHDAAWRIAGKLTPQAPVVAAGIGRWQIRRLAERMQRPYVDLASLIPASKAVRSEAINGAAATAVALLAN